MSTSKSSVWIFSITWSSDLTTQPIADAAFKQVAKKYIYQWERGHVANKPHCQAFLNLKVRSYHTGKPLGALLSGLGMKGVVCKPASTVGIAALQNYVMKDDTRIGGPWADHPVYLGQDLNMMNSPFPWQDKIIKYIQQPPDDRTIVWINDSGGNVGKSKLLKYLCYKKIAKRIPLGNATQLKTNVIVQGPSKVYCVDIPRTIGSTEKMSDLISAIEEIKGGWVSSAMYGKHQELFMQPPHVLVFSNYPPPRAMMSPDRWKVYNVNPVSKDLSDLSGIVNSVFHG